MRSLFRLVFPEPEVEAPSASRQGNAKASETEVPLPLEADVPEPQAVEPLETPPIDVPEGMIPAADLPSAAQVLADLFPETEAETQSHEGGGDEIHTVALEPVVKKDDARDDGESTFEQRRTTRHEDAAANKIETSDSEGERKVNPVVDATEGAGGAEAADTGTQVTAGASAESEDDLLDVDELIDREVAAARPSDAPADIVEPGSALQSGFKSADPIPFDLTFLASQALPEAETEILSIDLAGRVVDAATKENVSPLPVSVGSLDPAAEAGNGSAPIAPAPTSDWALEERLATHKEWVESRGISGSKANLACAKLENAELIGVNLRQADLQDSNLKGADLLLADLRDACLVRANLQEACLVGANLEGANLERATFDTAMGLVPRQLAGANLHGATLPTQVLEFSAQPGFQQASQMASRFFTVTMVVCAVSALLIWQTKDLQLLANSAILRFLHSPTAAAALPTAQIYLIAPVVVFILYLVFQFHLQTLWDAVLQLPSVFPDGRELGQNEPRIVRGLLLAHFRWMNRDAVSTQAIECLVALVLAYWVAPLTLLLFWARYLTLQDLHGTMLQVLLVVAASGVALYATTKVGRPPERWSRDAKRSWPWLSKLRDANPWKVTAGFGVLLLFLTAGTIKGVPHDKNRALQVSAASIRRWAPTVFWSLGYDPYADLTEASISKAPASWSGSDEQISAVRGAKLSNTKFRYAQAYGVFLVNAHLWRSNFQGAFLSDADLRGADLGQAILRYAIMDRARLYHANLDRASLDGANLNRADLREANLSYCSIGNAILVDARFQGASLYSAWLNGSSMERANLEKSDLRSAHLDGVNLEHANLQQAYLWSAKLPGASLHSAQLASAIFIDADLQNTDLRGAQFSGTVLSGTNLAGADIDGTDLRGALGLTTGQICSTKSRNGAILTDSLAAQVQSGCGGPLLAAPAPIAAALDAAQQAPAQKSATPATPSRTAPVTTQKPAAPGTPPRTAPVPAQKPGALTGSSAPRSTPAAAPGSKTHPPAATDQ